MAQDNKALEMIKSEEAAVLPQPRQQRELILPSIMPRQNVHEPVTAGLNAVDGVIPIGCWQQEGILGRRQRAKPPSLSAPLWIGRPSTRRTTCLRPVPAVWWQSWRR